MRWGADDTPSGLVCKRFARPIARPAHHFFYSLGKAALAAGPDAVLFCPMPINSPATPTDLFERLDALGIATTTQRHDPVYTVEESKDSRDPLPGGHCKSLFLKDKKSKLWLIVALEDTRIDLKVLAKQLGAGRFSFASPALMIDVLGVEPGAVTPFSLINPSAASVQVVLETQMLEQHPLHYHPLENDQTTAIAPDDLLCFIRDCHHEPQILEFTSPEVPS